MSRSVRLLAVLAVAMVGSACAFSGIQMVVGLSLGLVVAAVVWGIQRVGGGEQKKTGAVAIEGQHKTSAQPGGGVVPPSGEKRGGFDPLKETEEQMGLAARGDQPPEAVMPVCLSPAVVDLPDAAPPKPDAAPPKPDAAVRPVLEEVLGPCLSLKPCLSVLGPPDPERDPFAEGPNIVPCLSPQPPDPPQDPPVGPCLKLAPPDDDVPVEPCLEAAPSDRRPGDAGRICLSELFNGELGGLVDGEGERHAQKSGRAEVIERLEARGALSPDVLARLKASQGG